MKFITFTSILFVLLLFPLFAFGQVADTTSTIPASTYGDDFVDLSDQATIIKAEPEKPRVTLITDRIKPQFTDINLNKSFMPEILTKNDKILIEEKVTSENRLIIDIEKIVKKSR